MFLPLYTFTSRFRLVATTRSVKGTLLVVLLSSNFAVVLLFGKRTYSKVLERIRFTSVPGLYNFRIIYRFSHDWNIQLSRFIQHFELVARACYTLRRLLAIRGGGPHAPSACWFCGGAWDTYSLQQQFFCKKPATTHSGYIKRCKIKNFQSP